VEHRDCKRRKIVFSAELKKFDRLRIFSCDRRRTRLNRARASAFRIIAATPKGRTRARAASRESFHHSRIADWAVRNCLGRIYIGRGLLRLASRGSRTNDANESALNFQPDPIQRYSNEKDQNGANNDYRFDFPKQRLSELVGLRNQHASIPLNSYDLFKFLFSCASHQTSPVVP